MFCELVPPGHGPQRQSLCGYYPRQRRRSWSVQVLTHFAADVHILFSVLKGWKMMGSPVSSLACSSGHNTPYHINRFLKGGYKRKGRNKDNSVAVPKGREQQLRAFVCWRCAGGAHLLPPGARQTRGNLCLALRQRVGVTKGRPRGSMRSRPTARRSRDSFPGWRLVVTFW
jgi:hypothetical protein